MASLKIDFSVQKMNVKFVGVINEDFLNEFFTEEGPAVLNLMWPELEPIISAQVEEVIFEKC